MRPKQTSPALLLLDFPNGLFMFRVVTSYARLITTHLCINQFIDQFRNQ